MHLAEIFNPTYNTRVIATLVMLSLFVFAITITSSFGIAAASVPNSGKPIANNQTITVDTNKAAAAVNITLTASNPNFTVLTFAIVSGATHGTLSKIIKTDIDAPLAIVTYIPNKQYRGEDSFTFKVNDGTKDSNIAKVSVKVKPSAISP